MMPKACFLIAADIPQLAVMLISSFARIISFSVLMTTFRFLTTTFPRYLVQASSILTFRPIKQPQSPVSVCLRQPRQIHIYPQCCGYLHETVFWQSWKVLFFLNYRHVIYIYMKSLSWQQLEISQWSPCITIRPRAAIFLIFSIFYFNMFGSQTVIAVGKCPSSFQHICLNILSDIGF
jgi:hypothetical protein